MAIDDPVGIVIRQVHEESQEEGYLPNQLLRFGLSGTFATALAGMPGIAQIVTSFFTGQSVRMERRFLRVAEELNAQLGRVEEKVPDKKYYESEEFQSLLGLVIEKLQTTHDEEKLRRLGRALANCGREDFRSDEKEDFIRALRDLAPRDLGTVADPSLAGRRTGRRLTMRLRCLPACTAWSRWG